MLEGMPLVDVHVHVGRRSSVKPPWELWVPGFTGMRDVVEGLYDGDTVDPARFHAYLESEGVDLALVMAEYSPAVTGVQAVEDVLPLVEHDPNRVGFIAAINPYFHHPVKAELRRQLDLGAAALKVHPVHGGFPGNDRRLYPAYALCEEAGVPVVVHAGTSFFPGASNRYGDPSYMADVVRDFPGLKVLLAHGGRGWWYDTAGFMATTDANVFIEISGLPPKRLLEYFARFDLARLAPRFVFGTDWPGSPGIRANAEAVAGLGWDRSVLERVLYRNALDLYRLPGWKPGGCPGDGGLC